MAQDVAEVKNRICNGLSQGLRGYKHFTDMSKKFRSFADISTKWVDAKSANVARDKNQVINFTAL